MNLKREAYYQVRPKSLLLLTRKAAIIIIFIIIILFSHPAELTASHFGGGGGLLRKKASGDQQEEDQRAKSRQELIEQLILKSKQEKVSTNAELQDSMLLLKGLICPKVFVNNMCFMYTLFCVCSHVQRERQAQKEEAQELTEQLDKEWKSIQALMVKKPPKAESGEKPEEKPKVGTTGSDIKMGMLSHLGFHSALRLL